MKLAVIAFNADSYRLDVSVADPDVASYFEAHQADFRIPDKRKVKYLLVDIDALRAKVSVSPADLTRAYNDNMRRSSPAPSRCAPATSSSRPRARTMRR